MGPSLGAALAVSWCPSCERRGLNACVKNGRETSVQRPGDWGFVQVSGRRSFMSAVAGRAASCSSTSRRFVIDGCTAIEYTRPMSSSLRPTRVCSRLARSPEREPPVNPRVLVNQRVREFWPRSRGVRVRTWRFSTGPRAIANEPETLAGTGEVAKCQQKKAKTAKPRWPKPAGFRVNSCKRCFRCKS